MTGTNPRRLRFGLNGAPSLDHSVLVHLRYGNPEILQVVVDNAVSGCMASRFPTVLTSAQVVAGSPSMPGLADRHGANFYNRSIPPSPFLPWLILFFCLFFFVFFRLQRRLSFTVHPDSVITIRTRDAVHVSLTLAVSRIDFFDNVGESR